MHQFIQNKAQPITDFLCLSCNFYSTTKIKLMELIAEIKINKKKNKEKNPGQNRPQSYVGPRSQAL